MDVQSISVDEQRRVQEVQNLLATGIEQLMLFYFDIQRHGFMVPGSVDVKCYVCDEFGIDDESMMWDYARRVGASGEEDRVTILYCESCEFTFPWPCLSLMPEKLMETMRLIAEGGI